MSITDEAIPVDSAGAFAPAAVVAEERRRIEVPQVDHGYEVRSSNRPPRRLAGDPFASRPLPQWKFMLHAIALFSAVVIAGLVAVSVIPMLWGWTPQVVAESGMGPALRTTDVVITAPTDGIGLDVGTIVEFEIDGHHHVERIVDVQPDHYLTVPDALLADSLLVDPIDAQIVEIDEITGVGRVVVPWIGLPVVLWRSAAWFRLVALGAVLGLMLFALRDRWIDPRPELVRP